MPAFTVAKLKPLFPLVEQVCHDLKEHIDKNRNTGTAAGRSDTENGYVHGYYFGGTEHTGGTLKRAENRHCF
jgi:hypothetical protein